MARQFLMPGNRRSFRTIARILILGPFLLGVVVTGVTWLSLSESKKHYEDRAITNAQTLAQLIERDILSIVNTADRGLLGIVTEIQERQLPGFYSPATLNSYIVRQKEWRPEIVGFHVTNEKGDVISSSEAKSNKQVNFSDKNFFKELQKQRADELVFSEPYLGQTSGKWVIVFARAIRKSNGGFNGAALAAVALPTFGRTFSQVPLGPKGSFSFFDNEPRSIFRRPEIPGDQSAVGRRFGVPQLIDLIQTGQKTGTYRVKARLDGIERDYVYRRIEGTPFNLNVGIATEDYLKEWKEELYKTAAFVITFLMVMSLLTWLVYRALKNQEQVFEALRKANTTLDAEKHLTSTIVQSSPFAIYTRDKNGIITAWNTAAENLFGWNANEIIGKPLGSVPPDKVKETNELRAQVLSGETILQKEVERIKKDGSRFDLSTTLAPLRGADGVIDGYLAIATDVTERKATEKRIEFLAYRDVLTGLPNRLLLQDRFDQAVTFAERNGNKVALLFLDLDNFKTINDSLGHAVGDALLKEVAVRLDECVRETDTISRQGGDEFLIVLPDLRGADAITPVLLKIRDQLQLPFEFDGNELTTTVSIGVAIYPDDGRDFVTLLKKADTAMYRAKDEGRNGYRFFDEQMNIEAVDHLQLKNGLRRALSKGEFVLHYQPQIDLTSGAVVGAEALIRWNHPEQGMVAPNRFIALAEDSGLIVPMGDWVVHEACRQAVAWRVAGMQPLVMGVNLSAVQFKRGDVEQTVLHALAQSGLDPHYLELELTESILIHNTDQVLATVKRLKALGVKLSIDDFGTGYSSLSYLKRFDVDKLKIDQTFIRDLATDADDEAIVFAIVQMARGLNLKTIAEGVETADILKRLKQFRCDEAQGYFFARPMPADAFAQFLVSYNEKLPLKGKPVVTPDLFNEP
jgi:diguanylate cyclase (GGDEF)-like protein/PAS domain S-box-containing protein